MFLHDVEYHLDTVYNRAIFEAFFAREKFSDFLEVSFFCELLSFFRSCGYLTRDEENNRTFYLLHTMTDC